MGWRDVGFFVRGRLSRAVARFINRHAPAPAPAVAVDDVIRGPATPLALTRLLEGRDNRGREAAVARWLEHRGVPHTRHAFRTLEGAGQNFMVDVGHGDRSLVLIAHHDAVPKSPGANDNAAAVAILLSLIERWSQRPPRRRVRLLFSACEEIGYLGARAWVGARGVDGVDGVLSLELPGVGDSLAVWDAGPPTPFLGAVRAALESQGLREDAGYHVVGRIPVFGSDHRAFAAAGVAAYGFTTVPVAEADALRQFVFHPVRSAVRAGVRRPPPFDTYHTARDTSATLQPQALDRMARALEAVAESL